MTTVLDVTCPLPSAGIVIDNDSVAPEFSYADVMVVQELPGSSHAPCVRIAVFVSKRGNSSTTAKSPKKRHHDTVLESTTKVLMVVDVLDVIKAAKSWHLAPEAVVAQEALQQAMKMVCGVSTENVRFLH